MRRRAPAYLFLAATVLVLAGMATAASPHHPLSQIHPMDVPLNLSGQPIIDDEGNVTIGDTLNLSGNRLTRVGSLDCSDDEVLAGDGSCQSFSEIGSSAHDLYVNETGDNMTGNLSMGGNYILNLSDPISSSQAMTLGYADQHYLNRLSPDSMTAQLDMTGNSIVNVNSIGNGSEPIGFTSDLNLSGDSIHSYFGECNPGLVIAGVNDDGSLECQSVEGTVNDLYVNRTGDNMTGFLNMTEGATVTGIPTPEADGDAMNLGTANNLYVEREGDSMSGDLDMIGTNSLVNVNSIGNGSENLGFSSDLDLSGDSIVNYYGGACPAGEVIQDVNDDGTFVCTTISSELEDLYVNETGDNMSGDLDMNDNFIYGLADPQASSDAMNLGFANDNYVREDGDSMNGTLDMNAGWDDNNIVNINQLGIGTGSPSESLTVAGGNIQVDPDQWMGTAAGNSYMPEADSLSISGTDHGLLTAQNDLIYSADSNNDLGASHIFGFGTTDPGDGAWSEAMRIQQDGNVGIGTGSPSRLLDVDGQAIFRDNLSMNSNNINNVADADASSDALPLGQANGLYVERSGDSMSGDLDLLGSSSLVNVNSIGNGSENLGFTSDLDLSGDSLVNYYSSPCGDGEFIDDVADDGTFNCVSVANDLSDIYVNESGDNMSGNLDMNGNLVRDVGNPQASGDAVSEGYADGRYVLASGDSMSGQLDMGTDGNDDIINVGQIGIGTGSPDDALDVANGDLDMNGNNIALNGGRLSGDGDNEGVAVDNTGDVGIGTGSPARLLDVDGQAIVRDNLSMDGNNINNVADAVADGDAVNLGQVNNRFVERQGDSMTGDLDMTGNNISNVGSLDFDSFTAADADTDGEVVYDQSAGMYVYYGDAGSSPDGSTGTGRIFDTKNVIGGQGITIADQGTSDYINISADNTELDNKYVERAGDTMTGTLDMGTDGNDDIINVGSLGIGVGSPSQAIEAAGNIKVASEGQWIGYSGTSSYVPQTDSGEGANAGVLRATADLQLIGDANNGGGGDIIFGTGDTTQAGASFTELARITPSGQLGIGTGSPSELLDVDGGAIIRNNLSMNSNNINNVADADASSDALPLGQANGLYVERSGDSMTGNLDMTGGEVQNVGLISGDGAAIGFGNNLDLSGDSLVNYFGSACSGDEFVVDVQDDGTFVCSSQSVEDVWVNESGDTMSGNLSMGGNHINNVADAKADGDAVNLGQANNRYVERSGDSMSGDLDMATNDITNVRTLDIGSTIDGKLNIQATDAGSTGGTPEGGWNYIQFHDGQDDRQGYFGIDPNGNFQFSPEVSGAGVEVEGDMDLQSNSITGIGGLNGCAAEQYVGGDGSCRDVTDNVDDIWVNESGDNMSGVLDMNGNAIVGLPTSGFTGNDAISKSFADGEYVVASGDSMSGDLDMLGTNSLVNVNSIGNGSENLGFSSDLDLSGDSLVNYFGSACSGDEFVVDVQDDGTFVCSSKSVEDIWVNESGDSMSGTLDMGASGDDDIINVNNLGIRTGTPSEALDVNGGAIIRNNLSMDGNNINNVADAVADGDAVNLGQVNNRFVERQGDSMTGNLDMLGTNSLVNVNSIGNGSENLGFSSDLDLSGDSLVNYYSGPCSSGEFINDIADDGTFSCSSKAVADIWVNESGDNMTGTLDMNSNNIVGLADGSASSEAVNVNQLNGRVDREGDSMSGQLDMAGGGTNDDIVGIGQMTMATTTEDKISMYGNRLGQTNMYGFGVESGTLYAKADSNYRWYIGSNADGGSSATMELTASGLDLQSNSITGIGGLNGCAAEQYVGGDGSCRNVGDNVDDIWVNETGDTMSGNLSMGGNHINNVADAQASGDAVNLGQANSRYVEKAGDSMSGQLDMTGNPVIDVSVLQLSNQEPTNADTNGDVIYDQSAGMYVYYGSASNSPDGSTGTGRIFDTKNVLAGPGISIVDEGNTGRINISSDDSSLNDKYVERAGDSMTGQLDMGASGNDDIINVGSLGIGTGTPSEALDVAGNATIQNLNIEDVAPESGSGRDITLTNAQGSVHQRIRMIDGGAGNGAIGFDFSSDGFDSSSRTMTIQQNGRVGIGTGSPSELLDVDGGAIIRNNLSMNSNHINNVANADASSDALPLGQANGLYVERDGDSMNGNLDMAGNNIQGVGQISGDSGPIAFGNNLDLSGDSLVNYYSSPCGDGEFINDIADDGTFSCSSKAVEDIWVNESGDSMSGTLDMGASGNDDIVNVGNLGIGVGSPSEALDVSGNIEFSGDLISTAGSSFEIGSGDTYNATIRMVSAGAGTNPGAMELSMAENSGAYMAFGREGGGSAFDEHMRLTDSGDLGIGTETPSSTLDVNGGADIRNNLSMNSNEINNVADAKADGDAVNLGQANNKYVDRAGDSMSGNLDMAGNDVTNRGNYWWGRMALGDGSWRTSDGNSGTITVPGSGSSTCDSNNNTCVRNYGNNRYIIGFEVPGRFGDDWFSGSASQGGGFCWGAASGDNEVDDFEWGTGVRSVETDDNGNCASGGLNTCAEASVYADASSHEIYGVVCFDPTA